MFCPRVPKKAGDGMLVVRLSFFSSLTCIRVGIVTFISGGPVDLEGEKAQEVKQIIKKDKVVVFSKTYCPYCKMAKEVCICFDCFSNSATSAIITSVLYFSRY